MKKSATSKKSRRILETLIWVVVLGFVAYRFGPQVGAAFGIGDGDTELTGTSVRTLDGTSLSLHDLKGKVVLVNVWATWCPPCVIEMPGFQRAYEDLKDQDFVVLGISKDQDAARVREFLLEKGITYPVAMASDTDLGGLTDVTTFPTSYLIDRKGRIRHTVEGLYFGPTLRMAVKRLLAEN